MRVVHLSLTPVAGSPFRICKALNQFTSISARSIVFDPKKYGKRLFQNDLTWNEDREVALQVLADADIVHLHNWISLNKNAFKIDLAKHCKAACKFIRHLHGHPLILAGDDQGLAEFLLKEDLPKMVTAQFQERYYPAAALAPNIILDEEIVSLKELQNKHWNDLIYSATFFAKAFQDRWNTKAWPEVGELLNKLSKRSESFNFNKLRNVPHDECMKLRRKSGMAIDDLVTGSYHYSGLESLASACVVFNHLDPRTELVMKTISESDKLPFVNTEIKEAEDIIFNLIGSEELQEKAMQSREWMINHWSADKLIIKYYLSFYNRVLEGQKDFTTNQFNLFSADDMDSKWQARKITHLTLSRKVQNRVADAKQFIKKMIR